MLNAEQLKEQLPDRRWFGAKERPIDRVDPIDHAVLDPGPPEVVLAIVQVRFVDGGRHLYHLPLLIGEDGSTRDAFDEPDRLRIVGALMSHGETIEGERGVFRFSGPGLDPLAPPGGRGARALEAEQTNSSLVLDEEFVVKFFRRVQWGPNPDLELTRILTSKGFENVPAQVAEITYEGARDEIDLGIAQQYLSHSEEGWTYIQRNLHSFYDEADPADAAEDRRFLTEERAGDSLRSLEELGDVSARLHVALTREEAEPSLAPEALGPSDLKELAETIRMALRDSIDAGFPELSTLQDALEARTDRLLNVVQPGDRIRVHGDYHLGQVLLSDRGWMVLDFEGEPARSLDERRAKHSPLKDVAGMLRSFNYAALVALSNRAERDSDEWRRLEPWAETWETMARERFLSVYMTTALTEGRFLPPDRDERTAMTDAFELDKALYELRYERAHRPHWVHIPLGGIGKLLARGRG